MKTRILFTLLGLLVTSTAFAQGNQLLAAADSSSGTYAQMLGEISKVCSSPELKITQVSVTGGALGNLAALVNNEASIAFMHSDVIYASAAADPDYQKLVTLVALYKEEVHVIALRNSGVKVGGKFGIGGTEAVFNTLGDLAGFKVGASGGGVLTARLLQGQGEVRYTVVAKDSGKELIPALDNHEVQAVIFVGGAPLKNVASLDGNKYKLLAIPESISGKVQNIYKSAVINYNNLKSGPVRTVAPDAIILTRAYHSPNMVAPQRRFRDCFFSALDDLKETPGMHKKWQQVSASNHGTWQWYEIPGEASVPAPAAVPAPASKKKKVVVGP